MERYMQKLVTVRAIEWWPPEDSRHKPFPGIELYGDAYRIWTPNGWRTIHPGDYVVVDSNGHTYPCKPEVFHAAYEPCPKIPNASADCSPTST